MDHPAEFKAYGPSHLVMLGLFVLCAAFAVWFGRRLRGGTQAQKVCRRLAVFCFVTIASWEIWTLLPSQWDVKYSLPFELCDNCTAYQSN